jgi:hypothetical protein
VILFGPESHCQGSGPFVLQGGGGSQEWAVALLGVHTSLKNPRPLSRIQAYIACVLILKWLLTPSSQCDQIANSHATSSHVSLPILGSVLA